MPVSAIRPESIHPSLWRASQLARGCAQGVNTGHAALSAELPGRGWPAGCLIELLLPQSGIGELRLLLPVLRGSILLIQPPYRLQPLALSWWGVDPGRVILLQAPRGADACWAAEQALRAGTCDVVLLWQGAAAPQPGQSQGKPGRRQHAFVRPDVLRRLNLAAQAGSALFFMFRSSVEADQPSPAPLRLALAPAHDGVAVTFVKRHGPPRDGPLFVPLMPSPILLDQPARPDQRASAFDPPPWIPAAADGMRRPGPGETAESPTVVERGVDDIW
ncbi:cell division protein [Castellaniella sp. MT123]|uniref:cell division protein n=1 Tax=Castellaniella sp. MT123 TaxID=3140381 RepID=UPI0031F39962